MKKAIGYIRVSTDRQANEGVSLEAQKAKIEAWCFAHDYELAEVFVDAGISGRKMKNRQGLNQALSSMKKDTALVVYSLSRMSRSLQDSLSIAAQLKKVGADLVSVSESIDTTSAAGKMLFQMMAVFAEFESAVNSERTTSAMSHKKSKGEKYSAVVPFGYREIEGRLEIVKAEAQVVAEINRKRAEGSSLHSIAKELNEQGVKGKQGGKWYASTVSCILKRAA